MACQLVQLESKVGAFLLEVKEIQRLDKSIYSSPRGSLGHMTTVMVMRASGWCIYSGTSI